MHKCLTGLEVDKPQADDVFDYDDMTHAKIVGKITAPHGLGYLEAFRREKNLPGGVRKAAVVAPYEVAVAGRDQLDALTPQVPEITKIINQELRAMADEGCPNVQLDAPIFGAEVNMGMMTAQQAADLIAPCFDGVKATRSLHFCNGNLRGRPISCALHCAPWVDILERLDAAGEDWAVKTAAMMRAKSPLSLKIALAQVRRGRDWSFEDCMRTEFRIVSRIVYGHDFYEGVRAVIVDKDNAPRWQAATLADVADGDVEKHFAPLADELVLP